MPEASPLASFVTTKPSEAAEIEKWPHSNPQQMAITSRLMDFMAQELVPFSVVESPSFRLLFDIAEPRYAVPSRKYLSSTVLTNRHTEILSDVKTELASAPTLAVTLDLWTNLQMRSYFGATVHYIKDYTSKCVMLSCSRFKGSHTAQSILHEYRELISSVEIDGKISNITTDSAANMKKFGRLLKSSEEEAAVNIMFETESESSDQLSDEEDDTEEVNHVPINLPSSTVNFPCFDHVVQLIIKDGLKHAGEFDKLLAKCSQFVCSIRRSTHWSDLFDGHKRVQQNNQTRCNSSLKMVQSIVDVPESIWKKIESPYKLSAYELKLCQEYLEIMNIFQWATKITEGNNVTSSVVLPVIGALEMAFSSDDENSLASKFDSDMIKLFEIQ